MAETIRPAVVGDARAVAEVHVAGWQQGYRGLIARAYLDALSVTDRELGWARGLEQGDAVLVHEEVGRVDAFACFGPCRDPDVPAGAGEVYALYVHPSSWGSGIGGRVLAAAVAELRTRAASTAAPSAAADQDASAPPVLWVLEGNLRARRFYQRQGWTPDGPSRTDQRPALGEVPGIEFTEVRYRLTGSGGWAGSLVP